MKKIIVLSLLLVLALTGCGKGDEITILEPEEARARAEKFINDELISGGAAETKATINEIIEENGLYKLAVLVESQGKSQEVESYMTLDGSKFFTQAIDMNRVTDEAPVATRKKQDKPKIELFVMSHCPYGTQIEKGIIPVLETLGDKVDFELKFCDYAMHGEVEVKEQLNQYCIQKEEPEKLIEYLKCFLEEGVTAGCLAKANINTSKIDACTKDTDKEFDVMANLADKENWYNDLYPQFNINKVDTEKYGISGSPNLVINEEKVSASRDSKSLLEAVCAGFTNVPDECKKELSSSAPSPGFGYGTDGGSSDGDCS